MRRLETLGRGHELMVGNLFRHPVHDRRYLREDSLTRLSPLVAGLSKEPEDMSIACELVDASMGGGHVWVGTCAQKR